jgi:hypothetical protein
VLKAIRPASVTANENARSPFEMNQSERSIFGGPKEEYDWLAVL